MLITCEKCQAVYSVAEKVIGENGRSVKCAKCAHTWKVLPQISPVENIAEPQTDIINPEDNQHKEKQIDICTETNIKNDLSQDNVCLKQDTKALKLISSILFIAIIFVSLITFHDFFSKFSPLKQVYEKFGIFNNQGLELQDFSYKIIDGNLVVTGKLANKSGIEKTIPDIRYIILDYQREVIFNAVAKSSTKTIKVDQTIPIYAKIANLSDQAAFLQLDLYNKIELPIENNYFKK